MTGEEVRAKIEELRQEEERHFRLLDEVLRAERQRSAGSPEGDSGRWMLAAQHELLATIITLTQRLTNLEEMVVWAVEQQDANAGAGRLGGYRTQRERQEEEAGVIAFDEEFRLLGKMMDAQRPVTPIDRANIAMVLSRMGDRFLWIYNELGKLQGRPPLTIEEPKQQ